jgi:hypothetical protein
MLEELGVQADLVDDPLEDRLDDLFARRREPHAEDGAQRARVEPGSPAVVKWGNTSSPVGPSGKPSRIASYASTPRAVAAAISGPAKLSRYHLRRLPPVKFQAIEMYWPSPAVG